MVEDVEFRIIVETHTFEEGGDWGRLQTVLHAATLMLPADGRGELLVADACGLPELQVMLASQFPHARRVATVGFEYDEAKAAAARAARGRYLLYLDGDCVPRPGWHLHLLEPLRRGDAIACGGHTRYEGGLMAAITSIMDFGFLYPLASRPLACYASNNCGFLRETLVVDVPFPAGRLRCRCFLHAQLFLRRRTPMLLVPDAQVLHEAQPIVRERSRQGFDIVAALRTDPDRPEARLLRLGVLSIPFFYLQHVLLDWRRAWAGRADLELSPLRLACAFSLFPMLRLIDVAGMLRAFLVGTAQGGWGGWHPRSRRAEAAEAAEASRLT